MFRSNLLEMREHPEYEVDDEEALQDEEFSDDQFLADASTTISVLFKTFGVDFLPYFDQLLSKFTEFLSSSDSSSRQWALCVFCDLIEFTGPNSGRYQEYFLQQMAQSLTDISPDVRQASSYGVGVAARFGGPGYTDFCIASLPHLFNIINAPDSRSEENSMATENAISAVGKIIRAYKDSNRFDSNSVISHWVSVLPIITDEEEAPETYTLFLDLLDANHPSVVNQSQIPHLVNIITSVLCLPTLFAKFPEIGQRLMAVLRTIIASLDQTTKETLSKTLKDEQKNYLVSNQMV
jgi:hypothetical protein